jgi:RNA polymerase sigma-70 factor (ECF subfamily)
VTPVSGDLDDAALAALALSGRQDAFARIMQRHREPIFRLIRGHVGDADEALDLTQETFVAAYGALDHFDGARPMRAWLARIALNKCRDWGRRRTVRRLFRQAEPLDVGAIQVADDAPGPWAVAQGRDDLRALAKAIATLPASIKEPLLLQVFEELSQAEIGRTLGISEKAVETRIRRARLMLAERMRAETRKI